MASLLNKCPACKGRKKVMGMGMIGEVKCRTCEGVGFEKPASMLEPVAVVAEPVVKVVAPKKTVSRKKK